MHKYNLGYGYNKYPTLSDQPSDILIRQQERVLAPQSLIIYNKLPIDIQVFRERAALPGDDMQSILPSNTISLGVIPASGRSEIDGSAIILNDLLNFKTYTVYNGQPLPSKFVTPSMRVRRRLGDITIGSVVSAQNGYNRDITSWCDISSIKLHNMLMWPLVICHNGIPKIALKANQDLGKQEHGNLITSPYAYYDNGGMGIKIGDQFTVYTADEHNSQKCGMELYTFSINDRNTSEIFIGQGSTEVDVSIKPENYSYRLSNTKKSGVYISPSDYANKKCDGKCGKCNNCKKTYFPLAHNSRGIDLMRQHGTKGTASTQPYAKYRMVSKVNVVNI